MDPAWIECGFTLAGQYVTVSVRRLGPEERQRVAAEIAWFAEGVMTEIHHREAWRTVCDRILSRDVTITLDEERLNGVEGAWDQLVCRAFEAFVTANELDGTIKRHLNVGSLCD